MLVCCGCEGTDPTPTTVYDSSNTTVNMLRDGNPNCLPSAMAQDTNSSPRVYLAGVTAAPCTCRAGSGRNRLSEARANVILHAMKNAGLCNASQCNTSTHCLCDIPRAGGGSLNVCLGAGDPVPEGNNGWCYVQPDIGMGNADIVSDCSGEEPQAIRMIGSAVPSDDEVVFLAVEADI